MENNLLQDSLEYFWVSGNEQNKLFLPDTENALLSSQFSKKIGDSEQYEDCELKLYQKRIYILQRSKVVGILNFSFELTFELVVEGTKENEAENIKKGHFKNLKLEKDMCDCEFVAQNSQDYLQWQVYLSEQLTQKNFYAYYEVKGVIGSGAYASVVIAERKSDGKLFAVKSLSKAHVYHTIDGKAEIENELCLMRQIRHPNIMRLYEVFDADSSVKIVLELVEGGQLLDALKKKMNLNWFEIGTIMKQILLGLEALHEKNIMHRDLKPDNILMRSKNDMKLVIGDFGLATKADAPKYIYLKCGTPGYVAPEVINLVDGQTHYETKCDIFSAGSIFYRLCLHKPLFSGTTHAEVLIENKQIKFNLASPDLKDLPPLVLDLLEKLLQVDPKKRISATDALKHKFFKEIMDNETENRKIPFKGDVERARHLLKQEKMRNKEIHENSPLKMKKTLITGKTKQIQPQPTLTKRGSFHTNSLINLQSISSPKNSNQISKTCNSAVKIKKSSLNSIEEEKIVAKQIQGSFEQHCELIKTKIQSPLPTVPKQQDIPKTEVIPRRSTIQGQEKVQENKEQKTLTYQASHKQFSNNKK